MDDLTAFLNARLDEDEAAARAATAGPWAVGRTMREDREWEYGTHVAATGEEKRMLLDMNSGYVCSKHVATAEHIARHDPARVLREVEAGRAIIAACAETLESEESHDYVTEGGSGEEYELARFVLRHLAAAWSDRPDCRRERKP